ncbi:MAG: ribose-phosphate diphosphokinase [Candidatus Thermoplasmatota archaeon]|nr:ribose-phosphate diphosphokinase [Candidatus Thermoplasmatota archaeon]
MLVIPGSSSATLSQRIAQVLNSKLVKPEIKRFPDRECYIRILENLDNEEVLLVQNTYPDESILELILLQDAISEFKIRKLITLIPYFGYGRQDKKFKEGEAISARALAKRLELDTDEVITIDIHKKDVLRYFNIPAANISAMPQIGEYLKKLGIELVIAPDRGALELARTVSKVIGCEYDYLEKIRTGEKVELKPKNLNVKGKRVALVDDIISTGATVATASHYLKSQGTEKVYNACTHGLFIGNALEKLEKVCDGVFSTDTIESKFSVISVAEEVKKLLA